MCVFVPLCVQKISTKSIMETLELRNKKKKSPFPILGELWFGMHSRPKESLCFWEFI